jgi:hypothetical protein
MKRNLTLISLSLIAMSMIFFSCSTPIGLTSWKNPETKATVSKIVVLGVFDKMATTQPIENQFTAYFNGKNLPSIKALDVMNPFQQYTREELKQKLDSLGADGLLLVTYKSTDVSVTTYNQGFYGGYRGFYGGGTNVYVDKTYNLRALLYTVQNDALLWSGDLSVPDPNDVNSAAQQMAQVVFNDWVAKQLLKNPPPPPAAK